jgi:hypothetical protein
MPILALVLFMIFSFAGVIEAACTGSSPSWTSTSDSTSVASCISSATSGDTITVLGSGSVSWSVTSTKALKIVGPGSGTLTVTGSVTYSPTITEATKTFELSGFTFNGNSVFNVRAPTGTNPVTGLKIHNNAFNNASVRAINFSGLEFGVLYNNTFANNNISISVIGAGTAGESYPHTFGSANYLYVEDNTFGNGTGSFISETGQGGRLAFRHNTITGYNCSGCEGNDIHGDQNSGGTTISSEYYHNTWTMASPTYRWIHHRGGQAIIANNTVSTNLAFNMTEYRAWGGNGICSAYPAPGQIKNTFYFNNMLGGSVRLPSFTNGGNSGSCGSGGETAYLVLNRDYWTPSYGLASARPATCTANGNTYYGATDTDVIYKCTTTNTWTIFFSPYTYPHPLRSGGSSSDVTPPLPPAGLSVS